MAVFQRRILGACTKLKILFSVAQARVSLCRFLGRGPTLTNQSGSEMWDELEQGKEHLVGTWCWEAKDW